MPRSNRRAGKNHDYTKEELRLMHAEGVFRTQESGERKVIYDLPNEYRKKRRHLRLTTLESVWIQGKLRMWGAGRILAVAGQGICSISCWHQKTDENSH